jgi:hypothetical protein
MTIIRSRGGLTYGRSLASLVSVLPCIARAVTIFALCCAIGLQWLALQSIAWTSMIVTYSKQDSFCHAIARTFDGAHPCSLCHIVNKGKATDKRSDLQSSTPKIDMVCTKRAISLLPPFVHFEYSTSNPSFCEIGHSPPVPPPRSSAVA